MPENDGQALANPRPQPVSLEAYGIAIAKRRAGGFDRRPSGNAGIKLNNTNITFHGRQFAQQLDSWTLQVLEFVQARRLR